MLDTMLLQLLYIAYGRDVAPALTKRFQPRNKQSPVFASAVASRRRRGLVFAESTVVAQLGGGPCPLKLDCVINRISKGAEMNKLEIIDHIARSADISKAAAGRSLDAAVTAIKTAMKKGSMVTLVGFGTFYVGRRAARTGRNPQTGVEIKIKAARGPKFRPGKALKDAVN